VIKEDYAQNKFT